MTATVSFLPSAPAVPRTAPHGSPSRAASPASEADGAEGAASPADAGTAADGARSFSAWMREQQHQQQAQDRRRLAGLGPQAGGAGALAGKGGKAGATGSTGAGGDPADLAETKTDAMAAAGTFATVGDPIAGDAPVEGLAALLGAPRATTDDGAPPAGDANGARGGEAARGPGGARGAIAGDAAGTAGRADTAVGDASRRTAAGADARALAAGDAADGALDARGHAPDTAARGTGDAGGERRTGDVARGTAVRAGASAARDAVAPSFDASLEAARQRLPDAASARPEDASPKPPAAHPALGALASLAANAPAETSRADAAAAALPFSLDLATPVDAADFAPALGAQVAVLARDGVQRAELNLHPADMGPVSIDISIVGTTAHVDFGADVAATRSAIESGLADLAAALHEAGFTLAGGGVSARARERDGGDADGQAQDGTRRIGGGTARRAAGAGDDAAAPSVTRRTVRLREGAVDLYA